MLDPFTLFLIASAIPALTQGVTGIVQGNKAKNMLSGLQRPTFEIPEAAKQSLAQAQANAGTMQMAGQDIANQNLNQTTANALYNVNQNATSAPEALAAAANIFGSQMGAQNQLAFKAANDYQMRQRELVGALDKYAGWENTKFNYDVIKPFEEKAAAARALAGAGMTNKYEALKDMSGIAATALKNPDFKSMFGTSDNANATGIMSDAGTENYVGGGLTQQQRTKIDSIVNGLPTQTQDISFNYPKGVEQFGNVLAGATSLSNFLNPNITGYNQYGQPQIQGSLLH